MKDSKFSREQLRSIIDHYGIKTADDAMAAVKDMFAEVLQETLEAELDTELGYPKNGRSPEGSANRRNGHSKKTVRSTLGEVELAVPRDRDGDFEPVIVKKHQKEVSGIEEMILGLYAKGVTVRDIQATIGSFARSQKASPFSLQTRRFSRCFTLSLRTLCSNGRAESTTGGRSSCSSVSSSPIRLSHFSCRH